jgi:DNA ligase (NAD+)
VERAGDVIPAVIKPILEKRSSEVKTFVPPEFCPVCGSHTEKIEGEAARRCVGGLSCPAQVVERINHFVSKKAFNIEGMGPKIVQEFFDLGWIKKVSDIFALEKYVLELMGKEGWGKKSVENLFTSINDAKTQSLAKFIYALGIPQIGEVSARELAKTFKDFENFAQASFEDLQNVNGVGKSMAQDILEFFAEPHNQTTVSELLQIVTILPENDNEPSSGVFYGKTAVFTGTLSIPRDEAKMMFEKAGGKVVSSISAKTSYLICGENAGSKLSEANSLNIEILSEEEFRSMLNL